MFIVSGKYLRHEFFRLRLNCMIPQGNAGSFVERLYGSLQMKVSGVLKMRKTAQLLLRRKPSVCTAATEMVRYCRVCSPGQMHFKRKKMKREYMWKENC